MTEKIDKSRIPHHIAIIMDGNGRWAKQQGKPRLFGHKNGVTAVRKITEASAELGIGYLTLYAFSTENWNRPQLEVNALMTLLVDTMKREIDSLHKNNIKVLVIGNMSQLPSRSRKALQNGIEKTKDNTGLNLILALNYSSRWEITEAVKTIAKGIEAGELSSNDINEHTIEEHLTTHGIPDPELLIRTSGELRISNYLLWQIAYAELYFTDQMWPDFDKESLERAIIDYQSRERRFGKISEQII